MMELLWFIAFCVLFIVLWGVAGEILKNRGVASGSGIGFAIGLLTALIIFRTGAVISKDNLDADFFDVLFWIACLGGWIYVGHMYKKDKVILSNEPQEVGNWLLKASNEEKKPEQSIGWVLFVFFIGAIVCLYTMGIIGLIPLFGLAMLWRIVKTLEEIRDNKKKE